MNATLEQLSIMLESYMNASMDIDARNRLVNSMMNECEQYAHETITSLNPDDAGKIIRTYEAYSHWYYNVPMLPVIEKVCVNNPFVNPLLLTAMQACNEIHRMIINRDDYTAIRVKSLPDCMETALIELINGMPLEYAVEYAIAINYK